MVGGLRGVVCVRGRRHLLACIRTAFRTLHESRTRPPSATPGKPQTPMAPASTSAALRWHCPGGGKQIVLIGGTGVRTGVDALDRRDGKRGGVAAVVGAAVEVVHATLHARSGYARPEPSAGPEKARGARAAGAGGVHQSGGDVVRPDGDQGARRDDLCRIVRPAAHREDRDGCCRRYPPARRVERKRSGHDAVCDGQLGEVERTRVAREELLLEGALRVVDDPVARVVDVAHAGRLNERLACEQGALHGGGVCHRAPRKGRRACVTQDALKAERLHHEPRRGSTLVLRPVASSAEHRLAAGASGDASRHTAGSS